MKILFRKSSITLLVLCGLITIILNISCATKTIRPQYYILDYRPVLRDSTLTPKKPFAYSVQVSTMKIPRTFDRVSIVVRYSAHRLDYYRYNLWAIRPQITISDLIAQHISEYKIFAKCQREFLEERPDYEIVGAIEAIEKFESDSYIAAHLAMKLYFRTYEGYDDLLVHEFDREEEMPLFRMELFAKKLSDILREETDIFIGKIANYFENLQ
ncbi:membrane integrity-associated transporter subunit PqiC [candidate division KSB1 bacterium]|nr:membrane integrity-associated transporter subunit PqiC [candidate division KSB1 bacterium]